MERCLGVRKGPWTEEEDNLVRQCIQKYGEGKWHQVPLRAGLNRCRKSCRLRWLNYLKPNIKRGKFAADEVDLIIRLHKLLGNRWSLIAGRLPGRTANDVKNYWNTHLHKKVLSSKEDVKVKAQQIANTNIIKPRPRIFKKNLSWLMGNPTITNNVQFGDNLCTFSNTSPQQENEIMWWENLLGEKEVDERNTSSINGSEKEPTNFWADGIAPETKVGDLFIEESNSFWSDFSFDVDIWNLFNSEQERVI